MKTTLMSALLLFASLAAKAQTEKTDSKTTVHFKKIEVINGVKTVIDTTYTNNDTTAIKINGHDINMTELRDKNGKQITTIVITPDGKERITSTQETINLSGNDIIINDMPINDSIDLTGKTLILKRGFCGAKPEDLKNFEEIKIFIVKKVDATDASDEDIKRTGNKMAGADGKLSIKNMNFYPNPNNGKFNLKFELPEKSDTDITIMSIDGKIIYNEKLNNFSGTYDKEMDISKESKGVYLVKVSQGKHAQVKKIVLE